MRWKNRAGDKITGPHIVLEASVMTGGAGPCIYLSGVATDSPFVEHLARQLQARGLTVLPGAGLGGNRDRLQQSALCCVVVSPASMAAPEVRWEYQTALAQGKPVLPIITRSGDDLAPELRGLQWVDFSQSSFTGWLDLLMALDMRGLARWPTPPSTFLDWDLALARAYRGRMPYDWRAYRISEDYYRRQRNLALYTFFALVPILLCGGSFFLSWTLEYAKTAGMLHGALLALIFGSPFIAAALYGTVKELRPHLRAARANRKLLNDRSEIVIITPGGFGVQSREGSLVCQFSEVARIETYEREPNLEPLPSNEFPDKFLETGLMVSFRDGRPPATVPIGPRFPQGMVVIQQIVDAFAAFTGARGPGAAGATSAGRVFLSHARVDRQEVDLLDMALQRGGYNTWVDRNMLTGGQEWTRELWRAVEQCSALVVCLSPGALASPTVRREYEYAMQLGKPVLAVRLKRGGRVPEGLRARVCGDLTHGVEQSVRHGLCPLYLRLDQLGVRPAGADGTASNAILDLARVLWNCAPPSYQVVESRPPMRTGFFWFCALLGAITTMSFAAILVAGPGKVWDPANPLSTILVGSDPLVAFVAWFFVVNLARLTGSDRHVFIITPWSFLSAIIDMPAEFRFRQYRMIAPGAPPGTLRLLPMAAGRERSYRVGNLFPDRPGIAARVAGTFSWFQGHAQSQPASIPVAPQPASR